MVGTTREAADSDRVRRGRDGDETGDETGGPRDETDDKTAATAGDERDGGDRWSNNNNNNNWDYLYSAVHMGITKNKGAVTYKLIVIRLSKQKGLEVCFKAVYCR